MAAYSLPAGIAAKDEPGLDTVPADGIKPGESEWLASHEVEMG
jgi:hypothetical protein